MTWGLSAWGTTPWGLSSSPLLYFVGAHARAETIVRVTLSRAALRTSSIASGDALNPRTWTVVQDDTLAVFTVLSVREVATADPGTVFELLLLQPLAPSGTSHTVKSYTLKDPNGWLIDPPQFFSFDGLQAASTVEQSTPNSLVDFAKPDTGDGLSGATFHVNESGDYDTETGKPFLRKLFMRRITATPGGYFHLPQYGLGLRLKEPMSVPRMVQLRSEIERQLILEPEVSQAQVSLRLGTNGELQILLRVQLTKTGTEVSESFIVPAVGL